MTGSPLEPRFDWHAIAEEDSDCSVLRYLAVGFAVEDRFTGLVHDYAGGGCWGDLYYLDGERDAGVVDAEDYDDDAFEEVLEAAHPGILERIHSLREDLFNWSDEGIPEPSPELKSALLRGEGVAGTGARPDALNTWFS